MNAPGIRLLSVGSLLFATSFAPARSVENVGGVTKTVDRASYVLSTTLESPKPMIPLTTIIVASNSVRRRENPGPSDAWEVMRRRAYRRGGRPHGE